MGKYIGIDLGTTFSCMAYIDNSGNPNVIPNSEGGNITPSTVLFEDEVTIVGQEAKNQSLMEPGNYEAFVKRHMGERGYQFLTKNGDAYTPEAVSAIILAKLKADAEKYFGDTVDGAVVTVPAYFTEASRKATMDAGKIAGLNILAIINEPTAAALAFGITKGTSGKQNVMVFDLGGGTFDVTAMRIDGNDIQVLGTAGNKTLGGFDFDKVIVEFVKGEASKAGLRIEDDPMASQDLWLKAEGAKKTLSTGNKTTIMLYVQGKPFSCTLTREQFEEMIEPLLFETISGMSSACEEAGLEYDGLNKILLVGGSTRIPVVQRVIEEETGIKPSSEVHPDEAVAVGAAYRVIDVIKNEQKKASTTTGSAESNKFIGTKIPKVNREYTFTDVTSHGIGIVCQNQQGMEFNSVILPKNTQVPAEFKNTYCTTVPYQENIYIRVTQGEEEELKYTTVIGETQIEIEPRNELVNLEVTISCDENSIIHVKVYDCGNHTDLGEMRIDRVANLSEEEIEKSKNKIGMLDISGE